MRSLYLLLFCFTSFIFQVSDSLMSEAQLQASKRVTRNLCQPKNKAPSNEIDGMAKGQWDNLSHNTMCFMQCTLNIYKLQAKDNRLNYEEAIKSIEKLTPLQRQAASKQSVNDCKDSAKTLNDKCIAAYEIARCIYETNPSVKYYCERCPNLL